MPQKTFEVWPPSVRACVAGMLAFLCSVCLSSAQKPLPPDYFSKHSALVDSETWKSITDGTPWTPEIRASLNKLIGDSGPSKISTISRNIDRYVMSGRGGQQVELLQDLKERLTAQRNDLLQILLHRAPNALDEKFLYVFNSFVSHSTNEELEELSLLVPIYLQREVTLHAGLFTAEKLAREGLLLDAASSTVPVAEICKQLMQTVEDAKTAKPGIDPPEDRAGSILMASGNAFGEAIFDAKIAEIRQSDSMTEVSMLLPDILAACHQRLNEERLNAVLSLSEKTRGFGHPKLTALYFRQLQSLAKKSEGKGDSRFSNEIIKHLELQSKSEDSKWAAQARAALNR